MYIFIAAILWFYLCLSFLKNKSPVLTFFLLIPLVFFSTYRGGAGPDTINYYHKYLDIQSIINNGVGFADEPLSYYIMYFSKIIINKWEFFNLIYSLTIIACVAYLVRRYSYYHVFLLTAAPVFIIDGLSNTIRVSLAYFFFLVACTNKKFWLFWLLSFMSHVTAILMIAGRIFSNKVKFNISFRNVAIIFISFILFGLVFYSFEYILSFFPRIAFKLIQYDEFKTQSNVSGLSDIFVISSLLVLSSYFNRNMRAHFLIDLMFIMLLGITLYLGSMYSIGFMRFLKIIILIISISPMIVKPRKNIPKYIFILIGLLYTLNFIRIVVTSSGYIPYGSELF